MKLEGKLKLSLKHQLVVTQRDLKIIEFLNDMGPLPVELISYRFWSLRESGIKNCRRRLLILRKDKLLEVVLLNNKHYYRTTLKGVLTLRSFSPHFQLPPSRQLSFNLQHSLLVAWVRAKFEKERPIQWRSERRILIEDQNTHKKILAHKMKFYAPDGLYQDDKNKGVLFELEHYPKSLPQRKERISLIKGLLTYLPQYYQSVHIVSTSQNIAESYHTLTQGLKTSVEWINHLFLEQEIRHVFKQ